jgi:serine phosphatase RsbU (regulator of sigma subunit)
MANHPGKVESGTLHESRGIGVFGAVRLRAASWQLMFSPLAGELKRFAKWLEDEALPAADKVGGRSLQFEITPDLKTRPLTEKAFSIDVGSDFTQLNDCFLELGIKRLELDTRLEHNQIEDLVVFLFSHKKSLSSREKSVAPHGIVGDLVGDRGVLLSCLQVRLIDDLLHVSYHYCLTPFSKIVLWFENRNHHFGDHRALFQSAPRYGLVAAIIALIPLMIYLMHGSRSILLVVSVLASLTLFGLVYLFFMVVGSLEYDNEEKAYRLDLANRDLRAYARTIQDDMERAKSIQEKLLPNQSNMPLRGRLNWATAFFPETAVGGDYFDAVEIEEDKVALMFADVSGHGMSAAFITAILKATFQSWIEDKGSLQQFVAQLNGRLYDLTPEDSFAAVFVAIYDYGKGKMHYFNGGHSPEPILIPVDPSQPSAYMSGSHGMILGVMDDIPIELGRQNLSPGDRVLLVTDGITEAENVDGNMYGGKRLEDLLEKRRKTPIRELVNGIISDVERFADGAVPDDDRTILAFEIQPVEARAPSSFYTTP